MIANVTAPKDKAINVKLHNRLVVNLAAGESRELDATGDEIGELEALDCRVECRERIGPPVGSKNWRLQQAAKLEGVKREPPAPLGTRSKAKTVGGGSA